MHHNQIMNTDRTGCPLYKQQEHNKLCNYRHRYNFSSRTREKTIHFNNSYYTSSTCNKRVQDHSRNAPKDKCISPNHTSASKIIFHKFQSSNELCFAQKIESDLFQQQQQQQQKSQSKSQPQQKQKQKPATKKTKEIEAKQNPSKSSLASCLLCNKLQLPTQFVQRNSGSFILFTLIKLFPMLTPSTRILGTKQIKRKRQEFKSKAMIRLLVTLTRLLCVLQMTTASTSSAIENKVSRQQSQYTNSPESAALLLSDNTTATIMQASQQDVHVKNLVTKTHELDIIASSPAPVFAAFSPPGQTPALTPIDSRIIDIVNRENILQQVQQKANLTVDQHNIESSIVRSSFVSTSSCSTCQLRKAKNDSLESIKQHILSRLQLKESPKIEALRDIPQYIIDEYYENYDRNGRQRSSKSTSAIRQTGSSKLDDSHEDYMQSDDPSTFYDSDIFFEPDDNEDDDIEDEAYSHVKSVYIFPTSPRMRHNKKGDLLSFRYQNNGETTIMRTILHLYIRGWDWIAENEPDLLKRLKLNNTVDRTQEMVINVHRALRRANSSNYTHTVAIAESRQYIPSGLGHWVKIDLKDLADFWVDGNESHQVVVIKTSESWMRHFVVTGIGKSTENKIERNENALTAHIEVRTERKAGRRKRSTSLDCQESDSEVRCCRYPLKVNFTSFGWSFVVAPTDFDAFFCSGECNIGYLERYTHTHIASLSRSASPCCSPTKMSSLTLLYFNLEQSLVLSTIPNMTVEKCSCS